jgi:hypothetical protein
MAETLKLVSIDDTGSTDLYATLTVSGGADDGKWWNGTGVEAFTNANYANYVLTLTEQGGVTKNGLFTVAVPAALPAGTYLAVAKLKSGTAARTDAIKGRQLFEWDGTYIVTQQSLAGRVFTYTLWSGWTFLRFLQKVWAVLLGKSSGFVAGSASAPDFKGTDGTTTEVSATVDESGNRTTIDYHS